MVSQRQVIAGFVYLLVLALGLFVFQHGFFADALKTNPVGAIILLLYLGVPQFYLLFNALRRYFHWFFYKRRDVVAEIKGVLIIYVVFLVLAVLAQQVLQHSLFIITLALVVPLGAGLVAFLVELVFYIREEQGHKYH